MKFTILASIIGAAAAFAPASQGGTLHDVVEYI
jgi:hypothetical protein